MTKGQDKVGIDISERAISYLQMIQSNIERMSTSSAIFKGFAATIVAGIAAISFSEINIWILVMSFLPVICFLLLDVYYLDLEKKYRKLYQDVLTGKHDVDFSLDIKQYSKDSKLGDSIADILNALKSPSIILFYPWMIAILIAVVILKAGGII